MPVRYGTPPIFYCFDEFLSELLLGTPRFFFTVFGEFLSELLLGKVDFFLLSAAHLTHDPLVDENQKKKTDPLICKSNTNL